MTPQKNNFNDLNITLIHNLKNKIQDLNESEENFKAIFDGIADSLFIHDFEGNIIEVNNVACEKLGYTKTELLKLSLKDIDTPEYSALIRGRVKALEKTGHAYFETEHRTKEGKLIPIEVNARIITYNGKKVILSIARDISERKNMLSELEKSEERFRSILKYEQSTILVINPEGVITEINEKGLNLCRYVSESDIIGLKFTDLIVKRDSKRAANDFKRVITGGEVKNAEYTFLTCTQQEFLVKLSASLIKDSSGKPEFVLAVIEDLTEQQKSLEKLNESEEKYFELARTTNSLIAIIEENLELSFFNQSFQEAFKFKLKDTSNLFKDQPKMKEAILAVFSKGKPLSFELSLGKLNYKTQVFPVKNLKGNTVRVQLIALRS